MNLPAGTKRSLDKVIQAVGNIARARGQWSRASDVDIKLERAIRALQKAPIEASKLTDLLEAALNSAAYYRIDVSSLLLNRIANH